MRGLVAAITGARWGDESPKTKSADKSAHLQGFRFAVSFWFATGLDCRGNIMRFIGNLPSESAARTFSDILLAIDIEHQVEPEPGCWAVWVRSDDDFGVAAERLSSYLEDPSRPEFAARAREGAVRRRMADDDAARSADPGGQEAVRRMFPHGVGALTGVLAGVCVAIAGAAWAGFGERVFEQLLITQITIEGSRIHWDPGLPEIFARGEFWRLITPALVHFSVAHLILNLVWLVDLGSAIEYRQGTGRLGLLFLTIAIGSNLAQAWLAGPAFCGISGVVFGLLGYIWVKSKLDPDCGLSLHPYTVILMLVFFSLSLGGAFATLFGISMANGAHAAGLVLGLAFGAVTSLGSRRSSAPGSDPPQPPA